MFNLARIPEIMQTCNRRLRNPAAVIQLSQEEAAGILIYPAALEIGYDFLGEKAFKGELIMADCIQRVSCLRSCLFSDYSILADTLSSFKNFS